ncbi:MAG: CBS domain-containing protein [Candidatus Micrarchaeia archaeon]
MQNLPRDIVEEAQIYDYEEAVSKVLSKIKEEGAVVITRNGEYFGIVDDRALTQASIAKLQNTAVGKYAIRVPLLSDAVEVEEAVKIFYDSNARAIPFGEEGKVLGKVKASKMLGFLLDAKAFPKMKVEEVMASPVIGIDAKANVAEAIATMQKNKIDRLLIISKGKPSGIITNTDIMFAVAKPPERLPHMKKEAYGLEGIIVESIGTPYFHTIDHSKSLEEAVREMLQQGVLALAVTKENKVVGLLTARELFKAILLSSKKEVPVYVSGLEGYAKENEEDIKQALAKTAEKIAKFTKLTAEGVYANVKIAKSLYELSASIRFAKGKELHAKASDPSFDKAIKELAVKLYEMAKKEKEIMLTKKQKAERFYKNERENPRFQSWDESEQKNI